MENIKIEIDERDLSKLENDLNRLAEASEAAMREYAQELVTEYKNAADFLGAVDSGFFRDTIQLRSDDARKWLVSSDADYSGVIEFGRSDTDKYPARHVAARALDDLDRRDRLFDLFEKWFDEALKNGKKG